MKPSLLLKASSGESLNVTASFISRRPFSLSRGPETNQDFKHLIKILLQAVGVCARPLSAEITRRPPRPWVNKCERDVGVSARRLSATASTVLLG